MVEAKPNVEITTQVPPVIFHVTDSVEGQGSGCTPSPFTVRMGNEAARWAGVQL